MTSEEKDLLRASIATLLQDGETVAARFYGRLFELDPTLRPLFKGSIKEQGRKFIAMLDSISHCLDSLENLIPLLWQMGKRHGGYCVTAAHYDTVAAALLWTLEERLGERFTPEVKAAWKEIYSLIAATMQQAAAEGMVRRDGRSGSL